MSRARGTAVLALVVLLAAPFCPSDAGAGPEIYLERDLVNHTFITPPAGYTCWNTTGGTWKALFESGAPIPCYPEGDRPAAR